MEGNKDEAIKCLGIAQKYRDAMDLASARRFCNKSIALFPTPEATKLLASLEFVPSSSANGSAATSSGAEAHPSAAGGTRRSGNAAKAPEEKKRDYTPENEAVVTRVRACKITEYYEILSLKKDCEEADVKKAYRKLALQLHPDKNGAPGADEAFKMVSKAFQILSDPQKRAAYDQHGADPDSRFGGMSSGGPSFSPAGFGGGRGASFEGEISPEELFNMFFGGGGFGGGGFGGGGFGGSPVFTATFGPGGFRTMNTGRRPTGARRQTAEATQARSSFWQLAPVIILFLLSFLGSLGSLFSSTVNPEPRFSFSPTSQFNMERHTSNMNVKYHVNSGEFSGHPIAAGMARNDFQPLNKFERSVEQVYTQDLYTVCRRGMESKQRRKEAEIGVFGFGTDWEKVKAIEGEQIASCEELRRYGLIQ